MERIFDIINSSDFNIELTNLLIDLYSSDNKKYFKDLFFDENEINNLSQKQIDKLTKIAAVIEYIGNRNADVQLYNWIYSKRLKLEQPYTPGVEYESISRLKRIFSAPKEFSIRNVFFEEKTLKPM
ncbi:hypothetical protein [Clostridium grantii]|uniref:Uncharacterized protein n=1 Tax=Clostridium grantii DSM 8605 TaxID=1121316 RepID=A0A1M5SZG0_9CLOT|nr:hypothetical protein [Clostridium grantii]SHH43718.1 hypothetical protein SAMN02745207_01115 [Clostridium grantii DSM 8605]